MRILLTGASGYIGKRLLPELLASGHEVHCMVREAKRFLGSIKNYPKVTVLEADLLEQSELAAIHGRYDAAFYLVHSMSASTTDFQELEEITATNFRGLANRLGIKQVIYLSGLVNAPELSKHLESRLRVERILKEGSYALTTLRAGIIVGAGSASFEIIRDLVEKLPIMITPIWLETKCQPIGIADVLSFLLGSLGREETFGKSFDIGGSSILSYKEMLLQFAAVRGLKRRIYTLPIMTPRLSSYWLYFVTSTSYKLACSLVDSMKVEVVCKNNDLQHILNLNPRSYRASLERTFEKIDKQLIVSSWKDSLNSGVFNRDIANFYTVPENGVYQDFRSLPVQSETQTLNKIWRIGGDHGWFAGNALWKLRGLLDKLFGGVGLRRGRTHPTEIHNGDALDFWRVIVADKSQKRLLLFAEMKVPGDAWLEFKLENGKLYQQATFRPLGLAGRIYWWLVYPFHGYVFSGMIKKLAS